jgi:predicted nuclease of predicted toxin-antitoxin system
MQPLLLDENLSERLLPFLLDNFPGSQHIRQQGLGGAPDREIWDYALENDFMLVTKDEDFIRLSISLGHPPKVVCMAIGNANNETTAAVLLQSIEVISQLAVNPEAGFLVLQHS